MSTKEAAERACKEPNPIIDGRKANVNLAILGAKPRGNALQSECANENWGAVFERISPIDEIGLVLATSGQKYAPKNV